MEFLKNTWAALIAFGPLAVFFVGFLDSVGIPLVGGVDILMFGIGAKAPQLAYFAAALATVGSVLGDLILFRGAHFGGRIFTKHAAQEGRSAKFQRWFQRHGLLTIFIPALVPLVPLPLKVFVVSAGAMHTAQRRFLTVVVLARVLRYFGEAYLGIRLGRDAGGFLRTNMWSILGVFLVAMAALIALLHWQDRRRVAA